MARSARRLVLPVALALVVGATSGCALLGMDSDTTTVILDERPSPPSFPVVSWVDGWTAEPSEPLAASLALAPDACAGMGVPDDMMDAPPALHDQRGPDSAAFLWVEEPWWLVCAVHQDEEGRVTMSAWRRTALASGPLVVDLGWQPPPTIITGTVDPAAEAVRIETAAGRTIDATVDDGRFLAMWPWDDVPVSVTSLAADETTLLEARPDPVEGPHVWRVVPPPGTVPSGSPSP